MWVKPEMTFNQSQFTTPKSQIIFLSRNQNFPIATPAINQRN